MLKSKKYLYKARRMEVQLKERIFIEAEQELAVKIQGVFSSIIQWHNMRADIKM
jgi:hypothetical protein